ncbi:MAG: sulfurtransferase [Elusimicrobia bacterium]|nr:sulfurtransferase [Elusimicrobiota bacterium]
MKHSEGFLRVVEDAKTRVKELSIAEFKKRWDGGWRPTLVDVREESEWAKGHIPGAVHLGKGVIERDIEEKCPDHARELVLYCGGGFRSALAGDSLQKMGYTAVLSLDGDWRGWTEAGHSVEK